MSNTPTINIKGKSGTVYTFHVHKLPVSFKNEGGVYLFTKLDNITHKYIYLGITNDLSERFDNHHQVDCINRNGATHLCAFVENSEEQRSHIEKDILGVIKTTCNEQLK